MQVLTLNQQQHPGCTQRKIFTAFRGLVAAATTAAGERFIIIIGGLPVRFENVSFPAALFSS